MRAWGKVKAVLIAGLLVLPLEILYRWRWTRMMARAVTRLAVEVAKISKIRIDSSLLASCYETDVRLANAVRIIMPGHQACTLLNTSNKRS